MSLISYILNVWIVQMSIFCCIYWLCIHNVLWMPRAIVFLYFVFLYFPQYSNYPKPLSHCHSRSRTKFSPIPANPFNHPVIPSSSSSLSSSSSSYWWGVLQVMGTLGRDKGRGGCMEWVSWEGSALFKFKTTLANPKSNPPKSVQNRTNFQIYVSLQQQQKLWNILKIRCMFSFICCWFQNCTKCYDCDLPLCKCEKRQLENHETSRVKSYWSVLFSITHLLLILNPHAGKCKWWSHCIGGNGIFCWNGDKYELCVLVVVVVGVGSLIWGALTN